MQDTALFVVFYPGIEYFLPDYINSVESQIYKQFDIIVVNDGYIEGPIVNLFPNHNVIELTGSNSIAKNRETGINYIIRSNYKYLILSDVDDSFSPKRISTSIKLLESFDVIVNDLNIIDSNNNLLLSNYFSRTIDNTNIDLEFILDRNILGFSNTALRVGILRECCFPDELKIIDWYFFTLLLRSGVSVKFLPEALTNYRQHNSNLIGISTCSIEDFKNRRKLKVQHFEQLAKIDSFFDKYLEEAKKLLKLDDVEILNLLNEHSNKCKYPVWWEFINKI